MRKSILKNFSTPDNLTKQNENISDIKRKNVSFTHNEFIPMLFILKSKSSMAKLE